MLYSLIQLHGAFGQDISRAKDSAKALPLVLTPVRPAVNSTTVDRGVLPEAMKPEISTGSTGLVQAQIVLYKPE